MTFFVIDCLLDADDLEECPCCGMGAGLCGLALAVIVDHGAHGSLEAAGAAEPGRDFGARHRIRGQPRGEIVAHRPVRDQQRPGAGIEEGPRQSRQSLGIGCAGGGGFLRNTTPPAAVAPCS